MKDLIIKRHSVRKYLDKALEPDKIDEINKYLDDINGNNNLDFKLYVGEDIFKNWILGYGFIKNCNNYILLAGLDDDTLDERVGYYGEKVVLKLLSMGINSCFVGGTYNKKKVSNDIKEGYRRVLVLALGYGDGEGVLANTKEFDQISISKNVPDWYNDGIEMVKLAPSAVNQKKWRFELIEPNFVKAIPGGKHFPLVDLGIAKLHFEIGAGKDNFNWYEE